MYRSSSRQPSIKSRVFTFAMWGVSLYVLVVAVAGVVAA
jgi:hypothetical protein